MRRSHNCCAEITSPTESPSDDDALEGGLEGGLEDAPRGEGVLRGGGSGGAPNAGVPSGLAMTATATERAGGAGAGSGGSGDSGESMTTAGEGTNSTGHAAGRVSGDVVLLGCASAGLGTGASPPVISTSLAEENDGGFEADSDGGFEADSLVAMGDTDAGAASGALAGESPSFDERRSLHGATSLAVNDGGVEWMGSLVAGAKIASGEPAGEPPSLDLRNFHGTTSMAVNDGGLGSL